MSIIITMEGISARLSPILAQLKQELRDLLGSQLEAVYLYGSQARGDAGPHSDIDVLIVLRGEFDYRQMIERTSDLVGRISLENDVVISRVMISKERYETEDSPFLLNVRREGVAV